MNETKENTFWAIDEYLTYKMLGGRRGVEYNLYKEKGPAVFAFIGNIYKVLRNDDAKWIIDLALKLCVQLFD